MSISFQMGKYKRKSNRGLWSTESMTAAIRAVRHDNVSLLRASVLFGVPRNTLRDRLKLNYIKPSYAKESVLGSDNEKELVRRILSLQKKGFGLSISDVRRIAQQYAIKNNVRNKKLFNSESCMAGWDWYHAFMRRNPELSVRSAQSISYARAECMNRPLINSFFDMYEGALSEADILTKAQSIYNADESGLQLHYKAGKVVAAKGEKSVLQVTNTERGENVTVLACCSASGHYIPPFIVFKGKRLNPAFENDVPPGSVVVMSDSGYINGDLFLKWLQHFNEHRTPGKVALIVDGHASHVKNLPVLDYARDNNIILMSLPPHTTHFMQPLDRSFFRPLKAFYNNACRTFVLNHPGKQISKLHFGKLLNQAWGKAATVETACNGFKACGLFPVDRDAIPEHAYLPASTSEIQPAAAATSRATVSVAEPTTSGNVEQISVHLSEETSAQPTDSQSQTPSKQPADVSNALQTSFTDLQPSPRIMRAPRQGKSRIQKAAVLTSSTYRCSLQSQIDNVKMKSKKKTVTSKGKSHANKRSIVGTQSKLDSSDESSLDDDDCVCDDNSDDDVPLAELQKRAKLCKRSVEDSKSTYDNCVICGEYGPGNEWWFRCVSCSSWAHKACSGSESAEGYQCDFCQ